MEVQVELIKEKLQEGRWFVTFLWSTFTAYLALNGVLFTFSLEKSSSSLYQLFIAILMIFLSLGAHSVLKLASVYRGALLEDVQKLSEEAQISALGSNFMPLRDTVEVLRRALLIFFLSWLFILIKTLVVVLR